MKLTKMIFLTSWLFSPIAYSSVDFENSIHQYYQHVPQDSFTSLKSVIESGKSSTDRYSNRASMLSYLLKEFKISYLSQVLVFSNTSLQLSKISPKSPRAIFFSDDLYLGYVPNGQIEVIGIDPKIGAIPYIFRLPNPEDADFPPIYRSRRCMKCHASEKTEFIPGLLLGSVITMSGGGTLDVLNHGKPGHQLPYNLRFGGWYINQASIFGENWANALGFLEKNELQQINLNLNPRTTDHLTHFSDPIAHLVLEHQIGFINLCIKMQYQFREAYKSTQSEKESMIDQWTDEFLDYVLFLNEPKLPNPFKLSFSPFAQHFQKLEVNSSTNDLLRNFDLNQRLFRFRCSYMINGKVCSGLPVEIKSVFYKKLSRVLTQNSRNKYPHLEPQECQTIDLFLSSVNQDYQKQKRRL